MTDVVSKAVRSRMMSGIRGSNTKPEILLRKLLHREGFRFRLNNAGLPGRPDVVMPKHNVAVFVHGCFWHRHSGCRFSYVPASNRQFWRDKFAKNVRRDAMMEEALVDDGWRVLVVWECASKRGRVDPSYLVTKIFKWMKSGRRRGQIPPAARGSRNPRERSRKAEYC